MDQYLSLEKNLAKYIDARFPIIYIRTYEEEKADRLILAAAGRCWNGTGLADEMSTAFKGLSESEIRDQLSLAISLDGELTRKSLQLIFGQKQQMILKAGIREMVPLKEGIDDMGHLMGKYVGKSEKTCERPFGWRRQSPPVCCGWMSWKRSLRGLAAEAAGRR